MIVISLFSSRAILSERNSLSTPQQYLGGTLPHATIATCQIQPDQDTGAGTVTGTARGQISEGTVAFDALSEQFDNLAVRTAPDNIVPLPLPNGLRWEDLTDEDAEGIPDPDDGSWETLKRSRVSL